MIAKRLEGDEVTVSPQVLADLIGTVTGMMIPAGVIATWTPRERELAAGWAGAEHLAASDNAGIERTEMPDLVALATGVAASPATAQLAAEGWMLHKERLERGEGSWGDQDERELETQRAAEAAITGLLVLLDEKQPSWRQEALLLLGQHPEGVRQIDLFALLGRSVPSQHALDTWLAAGQAMGVLTQVSPGVWAVADPKTGATGRRQRPERAT